MRRAGARGIVAVIMAAVTLVSGCGIALGSQGAAETARRELAPIDNPPDAPIALSTREKPAPRSRTQRNQETRASQGAQPGEEGSDGSGTPEDGPPIDEDGTDGNVLRDSDGELVRDARGNPIPVNPPFKWDVTIPATTTPPPVLIDTPYCRTLDAFADRAEMLAVTATTADSSQLGELLRQLFEGVAMLHATADPAVQARLQNLLDDAPVLLANDYSQPGLFTRVIDTYTPEILSVVNDSQPLCYRPVPGAVLPPTRLPQPGEIPAFLRDR